MRIEPIEIRCHLGNCPCRRAKMILRVLGMREELRGQGIVLEVVCPTRKGGEPLRVPI